MNNNHFRSSAAAPAPASSAAAANTSDPAAAAEAASANSGDPSDSADLAACDRPSEESAPLFDVAVIGAGPAGLTAGLYASRAGLSVAVFERESVGGQLSRTDRIDNYPGFPEGRGGFDLAWSMKEQAERFGAQIISEDVVRLDLSAREKMLETPFAKYAARSVVIATGARPRKLGIPGEDELLGRGVSYCATCDGGFFRGKRVAVVGGGNTAVGDALYLSRIASEVVLIHRRDKLRATAIYHDQLASAGNIRLALASTVRSLHVKDEKLSSIDVEHCDGSLKTIPVDGLFIAIGADPNSEFLRDAVPLDAAGYIIADETGATGVDGVFAAGDVRAKRLRQVVTAVADGAVCAEHAADYLSI